MVKLDEAVRLIEKYRNEFRNTNLPPFEIGALYDLFPTKDSKSLGWPQSYPFGDKPGVYLILDSEQNILYIGKSSKKIGARLSSYFRYKDDGLCEIIDSGWTSNPRYIFTVAVPETSPFECASLEEFLLYHIKTTNNYNLLRRKK